MLGDAGEDVLVVVRADAAGHGSVLGEGVLQLEAYDAVLALGLFVGAAPIGQNLEGFLSVEVVTIDDGEGFVDDIGRHEHGVGGAPGLDAGLGHGEPGGNLVEFLGDEHKLKRLAVHSFHMGIALFHVGFHIGLEGLTDNIYHFAEAGFHGVVNGVVNDGFPVGAQAVHLFETAIAAAHAGSEYKECRFHSKR